MFISRVVLLRHLQRFAVPSAKNVNIYQSTTRFLSQSTTNMNTDFLNGNDDVQFIEEKDTYLTSTAEILIGAADSPIILLCEHASNRLPPGWEVPEEDAALFSSPLSYDIGAAALTRQLNKNTQWPAILSRFCPLICDPCDNETEIDFPQRVAGYRVHVNEDISEPEKQHRIEKLYKPFHSTLDQILSEVSSPKGIISIRSFFPTEEKSKQKHSYVDNERNLFMEIEEGEQEVQKKLEKNKKNVFNSFGEEDEEDSTKIPDMFIHTTDDENTLTMCRQICKQLAEWGYYSKVRTFDEGLRHHNSVDQIAIANNNNPETKKGNHMNLVLKVAEKFNCNPFIVEVRSDLLKDKSWMNSFEETLRVSIAEFIAQDEVPVLTRPPSETDYVGPC